MTLRHIALVVGSVVVLGLGLYLFVEVRSAPAQPPSAPHAMTPPTTAPPPVVAAVSDKPVVEVTAPPPIEAVPPPAEDTPLEKEPVRSKPMINNPFRAKLPGVSGKLETLMEEANKAYDRGDMDEARQVAVKVLARSPGNERMLRIMVSSSCLDGDAADAQRYYNQLPQHDRAAMKTRCERYGVAFTDPPSQ